MFTQKKAFLARGLGAARGKIDKRFLKDRFHRWYLQIPQKEQAALARFVLESIVNK
jgi:hypothetical protein